MRRPTGSFPWRSVRRGFLFLQEEVLREAGFRDTTELAEFYAAVCGKPDVPEEVLLHGIEQTVNNAGKIALTPFNVDETVLRRISGLA